MTELDCAICRGTGKYPASVDITGKLADCPDCTPERANVMRSALVAIQELHVPYVDKSGYKTCMRCGITWPCITRRLADQGLGGGERG